MGERAPPSRRKMCLGSGKTEKELEEVERQREIQQAKSRVRRFIEAEAEEERLRYLSRETAEKEVRSSRVERYPRAQKEESRQQEIKEKGRRREVEVSRTVGLDRVITEVNQSASTSSGSELS